MKRFMIASALALTTATGAFAATEAEITQIQQYLPDAPVSTWSDAQVAQAMNIINGTDSDSEITAKLEGLYDSASVATGGAELTENESARLGQYVDGVDFTQYPQATIDAALAVANSEMSASERQGRIEALLSMDDAMPAMAGNSATEAEIAQINAVAPDVDVSTMTDAQVAAALALINSDDGEDVSGQIEALVQ